MLVAGRTAHAAINRCRTPDLVVPFTLSHFEGLIAMLAACANLSILIFLSSAFSPSYCPELAACSK